LKYFENLSLHELEELLKNSHLNIGMGTSALDGAKMGIPTILIDASYNDFSSDYKYRWIFQTNELVLGEMINPKTIEFQGNYSFSEIIKLLQNEYEILSDKCYNYVLDYYDIEKIVQKIISYYAKADLSVSNCNKQFIFKYFRFLRILHIK